MTVISRGFFYATSCVSYAISCVLIVLVITSSPKSMQNFAVLVFDAAVGDLILATFDAVAEVSLVPIGYGFAVIFRGVCTNISDFFCFLCYDVIFISFYHLVILSLFSFYYRYHSLKYGPMKRATVIFVCIAMWIVMISGSLSLLLAISAPLEDTAASLKHLYPDRNYTSFYGLGQETKDKYGTMLIAVLLVYATITNGSMHFLRRKTELVFSTFESHMSVQTAVMHRQLMRVLTIQSFIPWALSAALISFAIHIFYFHDSTLLDHLTFVIVAFIPIFNSSVNILFIAPYRRRLFSFFGASQPVSLVVSYSGTTVVPQSRGREELSMMLSSSSNYEMWADMVRDRSGGNGVGAILAQTSAVSSQFPDRYNFFA